jgi:hypothetical protein
MPTVTKTLTATRYIQGGRDVLTVGLAATYAETTSGFVKIQGLDPSKVYRMLRWDVYSTSHNNQAGFYDDATTQDSSTEITKAASAAGYTRGPFVSNTLSASGICFQPDSSGCIYCVPNLADASDIARLDLFLEEL